MKRFSAESAVWSSLDIPTQGLEYAWFKEQSAHGTILRLDDDGLPFQVTYRFTWNQSFILSDAVIETWKKNQKSTLTLNYRGQWHNHTGALAGFDRCVDLDLWPTPLTNTFAIKRLNMSMGESREIEVLWIEAPSLRFKKVKQRYTRTKNDFYLFEDLDSGFKAEIQFDSDGLVLHYPNLFKRQTE